MSPWDFIYWCLAMLVMGMVIFALYTMALWAILLWKRWNIGKRELDAEAADRSVTVLPEEREVVPIRPPMYR